MYGFMPINIFKKIFICQAILLSSATNNLGGEIFKIATEWRLR